MKLTGLMLAAFFVTISLKAQGVDLLKLSFDNVMRSNGRIYVVIAVILLILIGLLIYILRIENKIKSCENKSFKESSSLFKNQDQ